MITILLVEDNPNQRMLYRMELEDDGYCVILASDGLEAIRCMEEVRPDLVVLDLRMPNMDGIETICRMRDIRARLPVIIYSAYDGFEDHFSAWGVDAYLVKSSDVGRLKAEIYRVLLEQKREGDNQVCPAGLEEGIIGETKDGDIQPGTRASPVC